MFYFLHRNDQNTEAMSKAHAIEDLHSRLKSNVESIQQLNQQVSSHAVLNHNGYSSCKKPLFKWLINSIDTNIASAEKILQYL